MFPRTLFIALLAPILMMGTSSNALATTDANSIRQVVETFMNTHVQELKNDGATHVEYTITALDNRLTLPACNTPLSIEKDNQSSNRLMLKVGCTQGSLWAINVPIAMKVFREVVTTSQPLQRGSIISSEHIQLKEMDIALLRNQYFTTTQSLIGKQVRRPIREGSVISSDTIEEPQAIRRGDSITIIANSGTLTVKMPGTALTDGKTGEQISVRNQSSNRVIKATVKGQGEVVAVM